MGLVDGGDGGHSGGGTELDQEGGAGGGGRGVDCVFCGERVEGGVGEVDLAEEQDLGLGGGHVLGRVV